MIGNEFKGKTVESAIEQGLMQLNLKREAVEIEILDEPKFLKSARVLIKKKLSEGEKAVEFAEKLFEKMNVIAAIDLKESSEEAELIINTTDSNTILGKRGEVLDAVQYLCSMISNRDNEVFRRIVVDCDGYRDKRKDMLIEYAKKLAEKANTIGRNIAMDVMNPFERRIVHAALQNNELVTTESKGEDPNRFVVIVPKNKKQSFGGRKKPFNRNNNFGNNGFKKGYNQGVNNGQKRNNSSFDRKPNGDFKRQEGANSGEFRNNSNFRNNGDFRNNNNFKNNGNYRNNSDSRNNGDFRKSTGNNNYNRNNNATSNYSQNKNSSSFGFGTFLGNAKKENEQEENK